MRKLLPAAFALGFVLSGAPPAHAATAHPTLAILSGTHRSAGQSIGSPTDGRLIGGSHIEAAPSLRFYPAYGSDVRWGLDSLVSMIERAARAVHRQFPDAVLSVGHLSRRGGGDVERHASHESGRDADLGFYVRGQTGRPLYADHMVAFKGDGTAPSWPGAYFDDAKNWALVSQIASETRARVTYIFVAEPIRARLLAYAARVGASVAIRDKAAELMVQPRGSLPHDDHFHVRIGCPAGMTRCIEFPTRSKHSMLAAIHHVHPVAHREVVTHVAPPVPRPETPDPEIIPPPRAVLFDDVDGPTEESHIE